MSIDNDESLLDFSGDLLLFKKMEGRVSTRYQEEISIIAEDCP